MSSTAEATPRHNPYVGPRPFRSCDELYGRDLEAEAVIAKLMAERILLVHAPSGAGKTSLLQSKVIPQLTADFDVSEPLRVNAVPSDGFEVRNRYTWSVIVGLAGREAASNQALAGMTLVDFLDSECDPQRGSEYRVLVLDQFEEVIRLDPGDREGQLQFFVDLGTALRNPNRWALFAIREDFMGGLAPFAGMIPSHLKVRYRIDFLGRDAALEAIIRPAAAAGVEVKPKAAEALYNDLARIRRQLPGEQKAKDVEGPWVEPVYLQVVCTEIWRRLRDEQGERLTVIRPKDVKAFGGLDAALGEYYATAVATAARAAVASERVIRDWFEEQLITENGEFRNQTQTGPPVGMEVEKVVAQLIDQYLIRKDERGTAVWYELAHDRLIGPLRANNTKWRYEHLDSYEISALDWSRNSRSEIYLLGPVRFTGAKAALAAQSDASDLLREFVEASETRLRDEEQKQRQERLLGAFTWATLILTTLVLAEAVVIVILAA